MPEENLNLSNWKMCDRGVKNFSFEATHPTPKEGRKPYRLFGANVSEPL